MQVLDVQTAMPLVLRPSFGVSYQKLVARSAMLRIPGRFGLVSQTLGWAFAHSRDLEDFKRRVEQTIRNEVFPYAERGAHVILALEGQARWTSSQPNATDVEPVSGWEGYRRAPSADRGLYAIAVAEAVRIASSLLGPTGYTLSGPMNEPELLNFYSGEIEDYFRDSAAFALAARAANPDITIAGPDAAGILNKRQRDQDPRALTERWAEYLETGKIHYDAIHFHHYLHDLDGPSVAPAVERARSWFQRGKALPFGITEWSLKVTLDSRKDTHVGAAFFLAQVLDFDRQKAIQYQTLNFAEDISNGGAYHGGYGFVTRNPCLPKASYYAVEMLCRLYQTRMELELSDAELEARIRAVATTAGGPNDRQVRILIARYDARPDARPVMVPIRVPVKAESFRVYSIDSEHTDPKGTYDELIRSGLPKDDAAERTWGETSLQIIATGIGGAEHSLSVEPFMCLLIEVDVQPEASLAEEEI